MCSEFHSSLGDRNTDQPHSHHAENTGGHTLASCSHLLSSLENIGTGLLHSLLPPHTEGDRGQQDLHQALLSVLLSTTGMTLPCSCSKLSGQMLSMLSVLEVKVVLQAGPSQPEKHLQLPA